MPGPMTLALSAGVLLLVGAAIWLLMRDRGEVSHEDDYSRALELWLEGNLPAAIGAMKRAAESDRRSIHAYLQLGNLLREAGDPARAANIHRSLTVRPHLTRGQQLSVALSLVEDLLALGEWDEVGQLLDGIDRRARDSHRYWRARFTQLDRQGKRGAASRALHDAAKRVDGPESDRFARHDVLYRLDRAMGEVESGNAGEARRILRSLPGGETDQGLATYVSAEISLAEGDDASAAETATAGIIEHPRLAGLFLPLLQKALLAGGRFGRAIPILESAVREAEAPTSLVVALAMLYEKVGEREQALEMIEARSGDRNLTPDAAAAYLRILIHDLPDSDFSRVWGCLHLPESGGAAACGDCGSPRTRIGWYCRECGAFAPVESEVTTA